MKKILLLACCLTLVYSAEVDRETLKKVITLEKLKDEREKKALGDWMDEKFGLTPYKPNYLLPLGYTSHKYDVYTPTDGQYIHVEAEFQVSLKLAFKKNLLGYGETYYGAYSQHSFWQLYIQSSPFRETNYNPELFVTFPVGSKEYYGLKSITTGYSHISNGQGNIKETDNKDLYPEFQNRSRSINMLYGEAIFQHKSLIFKLKGWVPVGNLDDNPDIMDYYGFGEVNALYFYKKNLFTLMGRLNPLTQKGAVEFTYSHPGHLDGVYFFVKVFKGYGESLIDYNTNLTKYSVGFAFSR